MTMTIQHKPLPNERNASTAMYDQVRYELRQFTDVVKNEVGDKWQTIN